MAKIPFKVSARTARLIGRENIASSKGAIIELVKNGYDADSKVCLIYFQIKYQEIPKKLSIIEFNKLKNKYLLNKIVQKYYINNSTFYSFKNTVDERIKRIIKREFYKENNLYIIDSGEGMTQNIIETHWMTIGTDNKANDIFTKTGRVKAGAKGIGRFALDKLGDKCEMITKFDIEKYANEDDNVAYTWKVDWKNFEGEFKTIDTVEADLDGIKSLDLKQYILDEASDSKIHDIVQKYSFNHGTVLKISELRDNWEDFYISEIFDDLEVLVPPKENSKFKLFLYSSNEMNKYGEILGSLCDDYDYKLVAKVDKNQVVKLQIYRNEYDIETINPKFFDRDVMQEYPFRKIDFEKGYWEKETSFNKLVKGFALKDEDDTFSKIGEFEFTFYFMKRTYSTPDLKKYFYNKFVSRDRKAWLNKFGGLKLFRDEFRVRPYGETKNSAFDWLGLGNRQAQNPAAVSKPSGGWKVGPDNVAGGINITRLGNLDFEDKSSREGLQENKTFQILKKIILGIVGVFEEDRANIAREMKLFYDEIDTNSRNKRYADELAKRILEEARKRKEEASNEEKKSSGIESDAEPVELILSKRLEDKDEEIENLKDEQKLLRGMASSGIVIASFSHDLSKISNNLNSRIDRLKKIISNDIKEENYKDIEDRKNPFYLLERMRKQDEKLQNWLHFALGVARKDKRKRKQLRFKSYFSTLREDWKTIFDNRGIELKLDHMNLASVRVFEIDIDSIFNNLLINSINAFNESTIDRKREIEINVSDKENEIIIDYYDNGPGLSEDIEDHNKIFEPMFTTNVNKHTGEEEGTGLGMWLVKSIVHDNDGRVELLYPNNKGFGIRIILPKKYMRRK